MKTLMQIIYDKLQVNMKMIKRDSLFREDLGADSLDQVELVMMVEDNFNIEMTNEESENMKKVSDIVNHLKSKGIDKKYLYIPF